MSDTIVPSLMELLGLSPVLLMYLVGMILALVFWRRYPRPCLFMLLANVLLFVVTVTHFFVIQYLLAARAPSYMLDAVGLAGNLLGAIGHGLLLAAVLLGLGGTRRVVLDKALQPTGPALRPSEEQGITNRPGD